MRRNREKPMDDGGDDRRAMIVKCFRCGGRRPWCRLIWKSAIAACGGTQDAAARRLFVTTSAVSEGLQHGRLSIDNLVVMMAELVPEGWRLPDLPSREEMMAEGLVEAMAFLRDPNKTAGKRRRISRDELSLLMATLADKEWPSAIADYEQAQSAGNPTRLERAEAKLQASAARISAAASRRRSGHINHDVAQLRELTRNWSAAYAECLDAVPFAWSETT
jgi:hypothetical protein